MSDGHTRTYLSKENRQLAEQLAAKKYLSQLLNDLSHEKRALDFYLRHHDPDFGKAHQDLYELPGYHELLSPYFQPLSQELSNWMKEPFESNPTHPENLVHKTISKHFVRSKSEAMIVQYLFNYRIPFRYEAALTLGNTTIYPDFTIRHPQTGDFFYWEHFGLMDDPSYSKKASSKLFLYSSHGIIPSIQLITTYETKQTPLSAEMVQKIVEHYFL